MVLRVVLVACLLVVPGAAGLCTFYTDPKFPTIAPEVLSALIEADITDGYAVVEITKTFLNPDERTQQVGDIIFPLPSDAAFITALSLSVDGVEHNASVVDREDGRQRFSDAVDEERDASLLEHLGGSQYALRVTLPPGEERTLKVRYEEALWRDGGAYTFRYPLTEEALSKPQHLEATVRIAADSLRSMDIDGPEVETDFTTDGIVVSYEASDPAMLDEDLVVSWVPTDTGGSTTMGDNGTFVLRLAPGAYTADPKDPKTPMPVDMVLLVDTSGSMREMRTELRAAAQAVLRGLDSQDRVLLATLHHGADAWAYGFRSAPAAAAAIDTVLADALLKGSTDLERGLLDALDLLEDAREGAQPVIVLVSDGKATSGAADGMALAHILDEADREAGRHVQVYGVQAGDTSTSPIRFDPWGRRLTGAEPTLKVLAREHDGTFAPMADADATGAALAGPGRVLLRDALVLAGGATDVFPERVPLLQTGEELVITGRLTATTGEIVLTGRGADGPADIRIPVTQDTPYSPAAEKIGAMVRLRAVLEELRLEGLLSPHAVHAQDDPRVQEILDLARDHGYVTPFTSLLVDIPAGRADMDRASTTTTRPMTASSPPSAPEASGAYGGRGGGGGWDLREETGADAQTILRSSYYQEAEYDLVVRAGSPEHAMLSPGLERRLAGWGDQAIWSSSEGIVIVAGQPLYQAITGHAPGAVAPEAFTDEEASSLLLPVGLLGLLAVALVRRRR